MFFVDNNQKANFFKPYSFPLVVHESCLKDKPMGFNNWHWHEEVQFSLMLDGEMITTAQGQDYHLRAGDGFFINSNLSHMSKPVTVPDKSRYLSLNVHPSHLALFPGSVVEQKYYYPYLDDPYFQMIHLKKAVPWQREVLKQLHALFTQIIDKPFGYELEAYSALLHIWKQLLENLEEKPAEERPFMERGEAQELLSYLKDHYRDNLTLDQVARHMHLSRSECCSMFRATYDTTIFSFLTDYRLQQSILLLTDSDYSVSRIAEEVGFQSASYYIRLFREKTGQTPLRYRRIAQLEKKQGKQGLQRELPGATNLER